ncbi:hypothetical protein Hanom_Chr04g00367821 [Helianthus anomalus]
MDINFFNMTSETVNRIKVLKKEFDSFSGCPGENTKSIIERYSHLVRSMSEKGIQKSPYEWVESLANAIPQQEWGIYLLELKRTGEYSRLTICQFIEKLEEQMERNVMKKKSQDGKSVLKRSKNIGVQVGEEQIEKISAVKAEMKADDKQIPVKCLNCEKSESDDAKLLIDAESLALEIKKLKNETQADIKQILALQGNCEKLKSENDKLLSNLNSLTLDNKKLKENGKLFEDKIKSFENEKLKLEKEFQSQIKILEDGGDVFSKNNIEKQKVINSNLKKII